MKIDYHPIPRNAIRIALPDTSQQTGYSCGASCLQSVCHYYGIGGEDESEYIEKMNIDPKVGSHPFQVRRLAEAYGLNWKEYQPMTIYTAT